jgi:hypothetical protein
MKNQEAKFILKVYRPDGSDASDPLFEEPLAQARQDPALAAWLKSEQALDGAIAARLKEVAIPDLREAILAGVRAGGRRKSNRFVVWLAAAAAFAVLAAGAYGLRRGTSNPYDLAHFALSDVSDDLKDHKGHVPGMGAIQARLADPSSRLSAGVNVEPAQLRADGCRTLTIGGRDVFEICFKRGVVFHLYLAPRKDFDPKSELGGPMFVNEGRLASATWADARFIYVAVTDGGSAAIKAAL